MNPSSTAGRDPLEVLAEEFAARRARGESPSIAEYEARYPALAEQIRDLFPALLMIEDLGDGSLDAPGTSDGGTSIGPVAEIAQLGDYRLNRLIGQGGMGVVYEAEQVSLSRLVAVKVLPRDITGDPKRLRRFEREARAAARLHHTNIVPVLGVGQHDGTHFYIMQLIRGQGLDLVIDELKRLRRQAAVVDEAGHCAGGQTAPTVSHAAIDEPAGARAVAVASAARSLILGRFESAPTDAIDTPGEAPGMEAARSPDDPVAMEETGDFQPGATARAPGPGGEQAGPVVAPSGLSSLSDLNLHFWDSVAQVGLQVAEALEYAHGQGVVHRDIKPSNLLLDLQGTVWVTDFGLARLGDGDDLSHPRDLVGTIRYMAPERFEGHAGNARSDLYSLGLTLYELLALRPAYQGANQRQLIRQVVEETPPPLRRLEPTIPKTLEAIVQKAIEREPGHRYATAGELAADLRRFLERRPIRARRTPWPERFALWCRRNPALAAMTVVAAALTITIAVVSTVAAFRLKQQRDAERTTARALELQGAMLRVERQKALDAGAAERTERERADRLLYTANLRLAQELYERQEGPAQAIADLLSEHLPARAGGRDLREFTWRLQWTRLHRAAATFLAPAVARYGTLTAEGHLLTLDRRGRWSRWDPKAGRVLAERDFGRPWMPRCLALDPGGTVVARGEILGRVLHLFDAATGHELRAIEGPVPIDDVEFSPDGRFVLTLWSDHTARVHEVAGGGELGSVHLLTGPYVSLALTPDGQTVLLGNHPSGGAVTAYELATGKSETTRAAGPTVNSLASSPDGRRIASGDFQGQVYIRSTADRKPIATPRQHFSPIMRLAFSADGRCLASGGFDGLTVVWDVAEGKPLARLKGHTTTIVLLVFSPDSSTLVSGDAEGRVKVWDLEKPDGVIPLDMAGGSGQDFALTPDGRRLITAGRRVQSWDLVDRTPIRTFAVGEEQGRPATDPSIIPMSVAISRDGSHLAIGDSGSRITVRDVATGTTLHAFEGVAADFYRAPPSRYAEAMPGLKRRAAALAFSPDGTLLAAGFGRKYVYISNYDQLIKVWSLRSGREVATIPAMNTVSMVRFTRDGTTLIAACHDGTVRSWDVATWRPAGRTLEARGSVSSAALSPDEGLLAAGLVEGVIVVWERATGREVRRVQAYSSRITAVAFAPDGRTLAAAGSVEQTLTLWEVPTLRELHRQRTQRGMISLAFSPAGDRLITADHTGVLLWPALSLTAIDTTLATEAAQIRRRDQLGKSPPRAVPIPEGPLAIAAHRLDAWAGRYRGDPAPLLNVTRQETNLVVIAQNGRRFPLVAESEDRFVHPDSGARFRFEADASGQVVTLVVSQDGRSFATRRLPPQAGSEPPEP